MSVKLDRAGVFKARPFSWEVQKAESGAVAVSIGFEIVAQFDGGDNWTDWTGFEPHHCYGNWWIVKKDAGVNQRAVEQLSLCLGWSGNLADLAAAVPDKVVQIKVEEDTYKGKTRFQAAWMNPEDFSPEFGASEDEVKQLEARFGSLLRAAASGAASASADTPPAAPPPAGDSAPALTDDDIPF